jgi:hypothetical protein
LPQKLLALMLRPSKPATLLSNQLLRTFQPLIGPGAGTAVLPGVEPVVANQLLGVNAPLCESTGTDFSIPLKSRIAPAAAAAADQDQL